MIRKLGPLYSPQTRLNHVRKENQDQQAKLHQLERRINHLSLQDDKAYKTYSRMEQQLDNLLYTKKKLEDYKQIKVNQNELSYIDDVKILNKEREMKELEDRKLRIMQQKKNTEQAKSFRILQTRQQRQQTAQRAKSDREVCHQDQQFMLVSLEERLQQITDEIREFHRDAEERRKEFMEEKRRRASDVYKKKTFHTLHTAKQNMRQAEQLERLEMELLNKVQTSTNLYKQTIDEMKSIQSNDGQTLMDQYRIRTPIPMKLSQFIPN